MILHYRNIYSERKCEILKEKKPNPKSLCEKWHLTTTISLNPTLPFKKYKNQNQCYLINKTSKLTNYINGRSFNNKSGEN